MKKVLAIVLTLAMLLSMVVVGTSAARVVTENKTENHYWTFPAGNNYNPVDVGSQSDFDVEMDIRIDDAAGRLYSGWAHLAIAPYFAADGVGVGTDKKVAGTYATGTWYHVKWDNKGDGTTDLYVDGALVGNVDAVVTLMDGNTAFWQWDKISIDNLVVGTFSNDMESGGIGGQGQIVLEENVTYANENVYSYPTGSKYWQWDADNAYVYVGLVSDASAGYQLTFDFRLDDATSEFRSYNGTDVVIGTSKIGVGGSTQACSLQTGVWYKALFNSIAGSGTGIVVWDSTMNIVVQTASGNNLGATWCGGAILMSIDNIIVADAAGTAQWTEDFEDGVFDKQGDSNGAIGQDMAEERVDLGLQYWTFPAGNNYNPVEVGSQSNFDVEMDIRIDDAAGRLYTGWANLATAPYFAVDGIGVGTDKKVAGTYATDTWYHVKWHNKGDGTTDLYVDGALVGNVDAVVTLMDGNTAFWQWDKISIDNLTVGSFYNDMEGSGIGGQGQIAKYEIKVDTIFDHFETTAPDGEAYLIENTPVYNQSVNHYLTMEGVNTNGNNFIMNYDLALLPVNGHSDGACLELWLKKSSNPNDYSMVRWKVGTSFYGTEYDKTKDFIGFDWGEATKDNFHNITYVVKADYNTAQIYIDKELVYEGKANYNWDYAIMMLWNANAIIDNFQMMDLNYNSLNPTLSNGRTINLEAEDFCATNGHINGFLTRTVEPTCYSLGNDQIVCAVCGEVLSNSDVDMVAHNWAGYDINRKTEDGLVYTYCKNDGCTEKRYTALPAADTYTGTLYEYYDMSDDMVLVVDNGWSASTWTQEDGVIKFGTSTNNYQLFDPVENIPANNWSWNLDIIYRGTFDSSDAANYGHVLFFYQGGELGINNQLGYNADQHKLFLVDNNGNPNMENPFPNAGYKAKTVDFTMIEGETYNIALTVAYNNDGYPDDESQMDNWFATMCLYVNGNKMIEFGGNDAFWYVPGKADATTLDYAIIKDFGINFDVEAMAFGSSDFAYTNRVYNGDVDGDYALTAADALLMRKYLARVIDIDALVQSRADANLDGAVNAKDQLVIRKAIAA